MDEVLKLYDENTIEDLETRLYSEVHHSKTQYERPQTNIESSSSRPATFQQPLRIKRNRIRYFDSSLNTVLDSFPNYIPLDMPSGEQNRNIYAGPPLVLNDYSPGYYTRSKQDENEIYNRDAAKKSTNKNKKKRVKKDKRQKLLEKQKQRMQSNEVICVSDDSDEECLVTNNKSVDKTKEATSEISAGDGNDDDIIYIPPPPVEVITIDEDENCSTVAQTSANAQPQNESVISAAAATESNDFLEGTTYNNTSENFNFSLHGSDFNTGAQTDEFGSPGKAADYCETESSSSTTEQSSRNFNNSVKTIVFDEVEFPRADIFAEKNLDTFSSLITPRRESEKNARCLNESQSAETARVQRENDDSRSSSSESDYEAPAGESEKNKSLPRLSLMVMNNSENGETTNEAENNKESEAVASETPTRKKKKKKSNNKVDGAAAEGESENNTQIKIGKKRSSLPTDDCPKKKKKNTSEEPADDNQNVPLDKVNNQTKPLDEEAVDNSQSLSDDLIIIDEVPASPINIDSDSDTNMTMNLNNVGHDLQLANCETQKEVPSNEDVDPALSLANFDVATIQSTQSDDPDKWKIIDADRMLIQSSRSASLGPRCKRCRQFGHLARGCQDKPWPPPCTLCGEQTHQEPRCPNKRCRQCGEAGDYSTSYCWHCFKYRQLACNLCHMQGHLANNCPDIWRRYHLTVKSGPVVLPQGPLLKPRDQQWCSGCAKRGHLEHQCNYYNREFPPTTPSVISYENVFEPTNANPPPSLYESSTSRFNQTNEQAQQNVPSLLLLNLPPLPENDDRIVVSLPKSSNFNIQINNKQDGNSRSRMCPKNNIKTIFFSKSNDEVKSFLQVEFALLENEVKYYSPKYIRDKLFKVNVEKYKEDACEITKRINMFIFGVHQLHQGKLHVKYMKKYLQSGKAKKLHMSKRRSLYNAYSYIFGCERNKGLNYYVLTKRIQQQSDYPGIGKNQLFLSQC